ncbi:MAG TPA: SMR family transporter [Steroidobacteraceae bacterium]|jgi:multidrug transporter EmrE-like cation transporter
MTPSTLSYLLSGVLLNAIAQLALKAATQRLGVLIPEPGALLAMGMRIMAQPAVWAGLTCYALSVMSWIVALSRTDVSVAYPFLSIGYVIATLAAWQFFGEVLSTQRVAAIALICVGVVLLSRS